MMGFLVASQLSNGETSTRLKPGESDTAILIISTFTLFSRALAYILAVIKGDSSIQITLASDFRCFVLEHEDQSLGPYIP